MDGHPPRRSAAKKLVASLAVLAGVGAFVSVGVFSTFTSAVNNSSTLGTATISLANTPSTTLINLSNIIPGDLITRCVAVANNSTVDANVDMTKVLGGATTTLLPTMLVSVEEGTVASGATPDSSCTGFTSKATPAYVMGSSAIDTTGNFSGGVAPGSLTTQSYTGTGIWSTGATKYFRVKVALPPNVTETVAGLTGTLQLVWTATSPTGSLTR